MPLRRIMGCRIKTGIYTGDGAATQAITGVGFRPKYAQVRERTDLVGRLNIWEKTDVMPVGTATQHIGVGGHIGIVTDALQSLDSDGFTVGGLLNTLDVDYIYLCLG